MCGMIRPIQPMTPEIETAAAVISVAAAITTSAQQRGVDAERRRLLVAQRQHVDAPAQQHERHEADQRSPAATAPQIAQR